jgi:uncharacterized protein (TIGR02271 family)
MQTIFGLFDDQKSAKQAADALEKAGIGKKHIRQLTKSDKSELEVLAKSVNGSDVGSYVDCVQKDAAILMVVDSEPGKRSMAAEILAKHGMVDVDKRAQEYVITHDKQHALRDYKDTDHIMQVVQENLQVGKREVERGRVRVYNRITEKEVEEKVALRDETIHVQRRATDRPVEGDVDDFFKERSFEVREVDEEAVVSKVARVIEEVVVTKDTIENVQTIKGTVRRSDVEIEEIKGAHGFDHYEKDFRTYFDRHLTKSGHRYEDYLPAFKFGHALAVSEQSHKLNWSELEVGARKSWEEKHPGSWATYKTTIQHAFEQGRT